MQTTTTSAATGTTIRDSVLRAIYRTIGARPAETGGMLGGDRSTGAVTKFYFDRSASRSGATYSPDCSTINRLLKERWNPLGIQFMGFVHSHPSGFRRPSFGDETYAKRILDAMPQVKRLMLFIVMSGADGRRYELLPYVAYLNRWGSLETELAKLEVVDSDGEPVQADASGQEASRAPAEPTKLKPEDQKAEATPAAAKAGATSRATNEPMAPLAIIKLVGRKHMTPGDIRREKRGRPFVGIGETFARVDAAYDLARTALTRFICEGVGGAADFALDLARAGVEEFVLIDPDTVSETNLATQHCYRGALGRPKVEVVAEQLRDINPNVRVVTRVQKTDEIDDADFELLAKEPMLELPVPGRKVETLVPVAPTTTILGGFTDDFYGQARNNRIGLQLGLPTLSAQVYAEGRGAELTFTHPDTTPACNRCVLYPRYKAFLEQNYKNTVSSNGTPIFTTKRLNALKGFIALALIHHGTEHARWGGLLRRIGNRNLVQIRLDPDLSSTLGIRVFDKVLSGADQQRLVFDEVVWLPQEPESGKNGRPVCPECHGTGNLRTAMGSFADTRVMPL